MRKPDARMPEKFRAAKIDNLNLDQFGMVVDYAKNLKANKGRGILLAGPPGVGKTYAIASLVNHVVKLARTTRRHFDYVFVTAPDMFDKIALWESGESFDSRRNKTWFETYTTVPWLIINDLGKEYRGGNLAQLIPNKLGRVIRERNERRLPIFITTNLRLKTDGDNEDNVLQAVYGDSITSLLGEMVKAVEVTGPDRRRQK